MPPPVLLLELAVVEDCSGQVRAEEEEAVEGRGGEAPGGDEAEVQEAGPHGLQHLLQASVLPAGAV